MSKYSELNNIVFEFVSTVLPDDSPHKYGAMAELFVKSLGCYGLQFDTDECRELMRYYQDEEIKRLPDGNPSLPYPLIVKIPLTEEINKASVIFTRRVIPDIRKCPGDYVSLFREHRNAFVKKYCDMPPKNDFTAFVPGQCIPVHRTL